MALPKLNESPSYAVTVPSSGQETTFRPFLVKEQKALMIAYETQERPDIIRAIVRTIHSCVEEPISSKLTTFDVDYLFTKIRSKSVGEKANLIVTCEECESENEVEVDLDGISVDGEIRREAIEITEDVSLVMKYPTYDDLLANTNLLGVSTRTEELLELIVSCMESVISNDEKIDLMDETRETVLEFVESMTNDQFDKVVGFVNEAPTGARDKNESCTKT